MPIIRRTITTPASPVLPPGGRPRPTILGSVGNATPAPDDDTSDDKAKSPTKRLPTYRIKFTKQLEIIRVYGIKSQNGKAAHYKDLVENGFLERNGDATLATKPVIDFALAHNWSTESAPRKLAPIIRNSWFGKILLEKLAFRSMNEDEAIADLAGEIAAEPEYKPQIGTLIEYAVATGLVRRDGSQLSLGDEATAPSPETSAPRAERIQTMPEQRDDPSPRSPASVATGFMNTEGAVQFHVSIKVSMQEMSGWTPDRISAFFAGLAQVLAAKKGTENIEK